MIHDLLKKKLDNIAKELGAKVDYRSCEDEYSEGFLDGSATGDVNGDGTLNILDIVQSIDMILNGE